MGALRDKIVKALQDELKKQDGDPGPDGPVSQRPAKRFQEGGTEVRGGWRRLRDIYADAVKNFSQGDDPSFKAALGGLPLDRSWCGIFAAHSLRTAGVTAQWDLSGGTMIGTGIKLLKIFQRDDTSRILVGDRTAENLYLEPGDVVTIESKDNHHVTIVGIDSTRKNLDTIEGNTLYQEISAEHRQVKIVTALYKVLADSKYPSSLFDATAAVPGVAAALEGSWKVKSGANTFFYKFAKNNTVDWGRSEGGKDGSGQWFSAGKSFIKMAWKSGSCELWDVTTGLSTSGQKGTSYQGGNSPVAVTADKI
jgi:hypothetical protein